MNLKLILDMVEQKLCIPIKLGNIFEGADTMGREVVTVRNPSARKIKPTYRVLHADVSPRRMSKPKTRTDPVVSVLQGDWCEPIDGIKTKIIAQKYPSSEKSDDEIKDYVNSLVCAKALDLRAYHMDLHGNSEKGKQFVDSMNYLGKCFSHTI